MPGDRTALAAEFSAWLRARGLTSGEYAARLGISPRTVEGWRSRGTAGVSAVLLRELMRQVYLRGSSD